MAVENVISIPGMDPVIKALDDIYTNFGAPTTHRTDNGPPFNSKQFKEYSDARGIIHNKVYPYHHQANPIETFMKPLGKAMKIAHHKNQYKETTLNQLLASYWATPHIATSQAPGNLIFQHGYQHDFPLPKPPINTSMRLMQNTLNINRKENTNLMHQDTPKHLILNQDNLSLPKTLNVPYFSYTIVLSHIKFYQNSVIVM